jgi:thiol-disulfide isomerase/thioredoxin
MKRLHYGFNRTLFFILLTASFAVQAEEPTGIRFFKGSWKAVLSEAQKQNKPVFIDIYTTWCGPCKQMARQAFPDAKVGEKFNANFISYQLDAERGEGVQIARKYTVTAYPTTLFVSPDGALIHRVVGYGGIQAMLTEADKAIAAAADPNPLSALEKHYASNKNNPAFVALYLTKRGQVGTPDPEALESYMQLIPDADWFTAENLTILSGNIGTTNSKAYDLLIQAIPKIRLDQTKMALSRPIISGLQRAERKDYQKAIQQGDENLLNTMLRNRRQLTAVIPIDGSVSTDERESAYRRTFYLQTKNLDGYRKLASQEGARLLAIPSDSLKAKDEFLLKRFQQQSAFTPDSIKQQDAFKQYAASMQNAETNRVATQLNSLAWDHFQNLSEQADLRQALLWSAKSVAYSRSSANLDTYAHLLSKLGHKAEAIKAQEEAIALVKAEGSEPADYEKSLAEMKQK